MSKKLKLSLENLEVESFTTSGDGVGMGTVLAHATIVDPTCDNANTCRLAGCESVNTWCAQNSCDGACDNTEQGLCGGVNSNYLSGCCYSAACTHDFECLRTRVDMSLCGCTDFC